MCPLPGKAMLVQLSVFCGVELEKHCKAAAISGKSLLMPSFKGPSGKRQRFDGSTVLACVYDYKETNHSIGNSVDVSVSAVKGCRNTFLNVYAWKVRRLFAEQNRISIVCDGSPFNGEEFELLICYCKSVGLFAAMQPQALSCLKCGRAAGFQVYFVKARQSQPKPVTWSLGLPRPSIAGPHIATHGHTKPPESLLCAELCGFCAELCGFCEELC